MVDVHVFFLHFASFLQMSSLGGSFLDRLINPLFAHLGRDSPLVDDWKGFGIGQF